MAIPGVDVRVFGKPSTRKHRRMGVVVASGVLGTATDDLRKQAMEAAAMIKVSPGGESEPEWKPPLSELF